MRILLTSEFPLNSLGSGAAARALARALAAAGHEVRCLALDRQGVGSDELAVRRIICRPGDSAADLPWEVPIFEDQPRAGRPFADFSDAELVAYRERLRRGLDEEVERFDPQIIHGQHLWVQGELILETGVPYVLTCYASELDACKTDERFRAWAEQSAENAGKIFTGRPSLRSRLLGLFRHVERSAVVVMPSPLDGRALQPSAASQHAATSRKDALGSFGVPAGPGPLLVATGRFSNSSGIGVLLNALGRLQHAGEKLTVVGDGPLRRALETQARVLGLSGLHFIGERSLDECDRLFALADLALALGDGDVEESFLLSALARSDAVIGWSLGEDVMHPAAMGVTPDDHELLAEAMLESLARQRETASGSAAAYLAEHHAPERIAPWVAAVYDDVFQRRLASSDAAMRLRREQQSKRPS